MSQNEYLRPSQVAKEYPISISSIWRYAKLGLLHPKKITSGCTVLLRSELEAFFNGKSNTEVSQWKDKAQPLRWGRELLFGRHNSTLKPHHKSINPKREKLPHGGQ